MQNWIKVASVTTGGKSHFYVCNGGIPYTRRSVCWNRQTCTWQAEENDKTIGYYDNIVDAKKAF